jgi:DNA processing protein
MNYYISLSLLKIPNYLKKEIMLMLTEDEIKELFDGKYLELNMKYNFSSLTYDKIFMDTEELIKIINMTKRIEAENKKHKIKVTTIIDTNYPHNLKQINDAPVVLYYKGRGIYKKHIKSIGCVGTRTPTNFGIRAVNSLVEKLVKEEFTIISGLAEGIDTISHQKCLVENGSTIAVVAHGLDKIYPKSNIELAKAIINNKGVIISEYPVGTLPEKHRFVKRNRLISGLSKGVIVFEAKEKSGTMHTVNYAKEQKKKIFCPIPIEHNPVTSGLHKLLKNNTAIGIRTKEDYDVIITSLGYKIKDKSKEKELKVKQFNRLFNNFNINIHEINYRKETEGKTGFSIDKELRKEFKAILAKNGLTMREVFNAFVLSVVNQEKK